MRTILFLFICLSIFKPTLSKATDVEGFIISSNGDTIKTFLRLPWNIATLSIDYEKIQLQITMFDTSTGVTKIVSPSDIKGFGFYRNNHLHVFYSKPTLKGYNLFLQPFSLGKVNVYHYDTAVYINNARSTLYHYTIERNDGKVLFWPNNHIKAKEFKKQLKEFLSGEQDIDKLMWGRFLTSDKINIDLRYLVTRINDPSLPRFSPNP